MKKALFGLFLLLALAFGLVWWQTGREVQGQLERVAGQLAPSGRLTWQGLRPDARGQVIIQGLEYRPHDSRDSMRLDQLVLRADSLPALIGAVRRIGRGELPRHGGIGLRGLHLPVNRQLQGVRADSTGLVLPLLAAGCPGMEGFSLEQLGRLGYNELLIDGEIDFRITDERLSLSSRVSTQGLAVVSQDWQLALERPLAGISDLSKLPSGQIEVVQMDYLDTGLNERLDAHCIRASGLQPGAWRLGHLRAWMDQWARIGLRPEPLVIAGYRHFLSEPRSGLSIRLEPDPPLPLAELDSGEWHRLLERMKPEFAINNGPAIAMAARPVARPAPEIPEPEADVASTSVQTAPLELSQDRDEEQAVIEVGPIPTWQLISTGQIAAHHGDNARIELSDGSTRSGRILDSDGNSLQLLTRSRTGEFARPVRFDEIQRIEVRP